MEKVAKDLALDYIPSWVQARLAAECTQGAVRRTGAWAKGVWYIAEDLEGTRIEVSQDSQAKFKVDLQAGGFHRLEVVDWAPDPASEGDPATTSQALIHLLSELGAPYRYFEELLRAEMAVLRERPASLEALKRQLEAVEEHLQEKPVWRAVAAKVVELLELLKAGSSPEEEAVQQKQSELQAAREEVVQQKQQLTLPDSDRLVLLPDRSGRLPPGQVSIWPRGAKDFVLGSTLLYRDPGLRREDVQLVRAVRYTDLFESGETPPMAFKCAIIISTHPSCSFSLAEALANGDFDGDRAKASWHAELLGFVGRRARAPKEPEVPRAAGPEAKTVGQLAHRPEDLEQELRAHCARQVLVQRDIGSVYEAWMKAVEFGGAPLRAATARVWCSSRMEAGGVGSEAARACAEQYGLLLDAAKSGHRLPWGFLRRWGLQRLPGLPYRKGGVDRGQDARRQSAVWRLWRAQKDGLQGPELPAVQRPGLRSLFFVGGC